MIPCIQHVLYLHALEAKLLRRRAIQIYLLIGVIKSALFLTTKLYPIKKRMWVFSSPLTSVKIYLRYLQGRNHIFKVGGSVFWYKVLLPFYRKKLDRSSQFGAVGFIITLFIKKLYVKTW